MNLTYGSLLLISLLLFGSTYAQNDTIIGITPSTTEPRLVSFNSAAPAQTLIVGPQISQLTAGQIIRSADFRPATGQLYIIATTAPSNNLQIAQLYTIDLNTGNASPVGSTFTLVSSSTQVHIDFNPVADRIRLTTGDNHNLRLDPNTGNVAGVDGNLTFAASDPNAGDVPLVQNIAYSNNNPGAASTTLYALESGNNILATIAPPNTGTLNQVALLSRTLIAPVGFDISGSTGLAYVSNGNGEFFLLNLANGILTSRGGSTAFIDISVVPTTSVTTSISATTAQVTSGLAAVTTNRITTMATPVTTGIQVTTGLATGTTCSPNGSQRCVNQTAYTICTNGRFSIPQSCQSGLVCSPSGNNVYCVRAASTTAGRVTTGANPITTGSRVTTAAVPMTTGLGSQVFPGQPCANNGFQSCVAGAPSNYSTCTNGVGSNQMCQAGLACTQSGNNIYCV